MAVAWVSDLSKEEVALVPFCHAKAHGMCAESESAVCLVACMSQTCPACPSTRLHQTRAQWSVVAGITLQVSQCLLHMCLFELTLCTVGSTAKAGACAAYSVIPQDLLWLLCTHTSTNSAPVLNLMQR